MTSHRRATHHPPSPAATPVAGVARSFPGAQAQGLERADASLRRTVPSWHVRGGDALDTSRSSVATWWVQPHGEVRLQVARLPLSSGGQVLGRRLVSSRRNVLST